MRSPAWSSRTSRSPCAPSCTRSPTPCWGGSNERPQLAPADTGASRASTCTPTSPSRARAWSSAGTRPRSAWRPGCSARRCASASRTSTPWCASPTRSSTGAPTRRAWMRLVAARLLNDLERDTERALEEGYSANLVVHAFARTARAAGFGAELTEPFFASMRMDLSATEHDEESFRRYVYGSAEVVGLMCLRIFVSDEGRDAGRDYSDAELATLEAGARALGSAFQKVNFLRDLARRLGIARAQLLPGTRRRESHRHPEAPPARRHRRRARRRRPDAAAASPQLAARGRGGARSVRRAVAPHPRDARAPNSSAPRVRVPDPVKLAHRCSTARRKGHMTRTIVIGGGIAGLATAALLAREGHKVTLLETARRGRRPRRHLGARRVPVRHRAVVVPDAGGVRPLLPLLGTTADEQLDLVQLDPGYRVYFEGHADPLDVSAERRREPRPLRGHRARRGAAAREVPGHRARDLRPGEGALPLLDVPAARAGVRRRRHGARSRACSAC